MLLQQPLLQPSTAFEISNERMKSNYWLLLCCESISFGWNTLLARCIHFLIVLFISCRHLLRISVIVCPPRIEVPSCDSSVEKALQYENINYTTSSAVSLPYARLTRYNGHQCLRFFTSRHLRISRDSVALHAGVAFRTTRWWVNIRQLTWFHTLAKEAFQTAIQHMYHHLMLAPTEITRTVWRKRLQPIDLSFIRFFTYLDDKIEPPLKRRTRCKVES